MAGIKLKRSAVQGKTPTTVDMLVGELALNTFDGRAFLRGNDGADFVREMAVKDAQGNLTANSFYDSFQTIPSASGITSLTNASPGITLITGTLPQSVKLPDATTLKLGRAFHIYNRSTDVVNVQDNSAFFLAQIQPGSSVSFRATSITTATGTWDINVGGGGGGGGSGIGGIDYLSLNKISNDGEVNTAGWSTFNTTFTNGLPGAITAGSTLVNIARDTTNPLRGKGSLQLNVTTAPGSVGHGVITDPFTISSADLAKVLTVLSDYSFVSGAANVDVSGTTTQTLELWIYNVTLGQWTQPAGFRGINQTKGAGKVAATFQTDSQAANNSYRFAFIIRNAPTDVFSMDFEVSIGPSLIPLGTPVTEWQAYTPVISGLGTGSVTNNQAFWRRVGENIEINGGFRKDASAGTGTTNVTLSLPSGFSVDTNKFNGAVPAATTAGFYELNATGGNWASPGEVILGSGFSSSVIGFSGPVGGGAFLQGGQIPASAGFGFICSIPILGWGSSVQMSNDTDTRVVAAKYRIPANQAMAAGASINFGTKIIDTHNAVSTTSTTGAGTWKFTAPISGIYRVYGNLSNTTGATNLGIYINGTLYELGTTIGTSNIYAYNFLVPLNAGDYFHLGYTAGATVGGSATGLIVNVDRLSGPSTIAASEAINAKYLTTSGQAISATATAISFGTQVFDSHGAFSGSTFTCPVSGVYEVGCMLTTASTTLASGQVLEILLYKNGTFYSELGCTFGTGATTVYRVSGAPVGVRCNAGDTLQVYVSCAVATSLYTTSGYNRIEIKKIGN